MFCTAGTSRKNALTGHYRLLNGGNFRRAPGARWHDCRIRLAQIPQRRAETASDAGAGRDTCCTGWCGSHIVDGATWPSSCATRASTSIFNVTYPTTRGSIADHAAALDRVILAPAGGHRHDSLCGPQPGQPGDCTIWATHRSGRPVACPTRPGRIVMLGLPNNGARLAEVFGRAGRSSCARQIGHRDSRLRASRKPGSPCPRASSSLSPGGAGRRATTPGWPATTIWW